MISVPFGFPFAMYHLESSRSGGLNPIEISTRNPMEHQFFPIPAHLTSPPRDLPPSENTTNNGVDLDSSNHDSLKDFSSKASAFREKNSSASSAPDLPPPKPGIENSETIGTDRTPRVSDLGNVPNYQISDNPISIILEQLFEASHQNFFLETFPGGTEFPLAPAATGREINPPTSPNKVTLEDWLINQREHDENFMFDDDDDYEEIEMSEEEEEIDRYDGGEVIDPDAIDGDFRN